MICLIALVVEILLREERNCIDLRKTVGKKKVFGMRSVSLQPMILCVNVIAQIKCLDLKMNLGCSIFTKREINSKIIGLGISCVRFKS